MAVSQSAQFGLLLTDEEQFRKEILSLPRYTEAERRLLFDRARQGDRDARERFLLSFTGYVVSVARRFAQINESSHRIEFLDLVQIGRLALLERLDKALESPNPIGFLNRVASGAIISFCLTGGSLIRSPRDRKGPQPLKPCDSLSAPVRKSDGTIGEQTFEDVLVSELRLPEPEAEDMYAELYQALDVLSDGCREVITRLYGLGCAPESLTDIMESRVLARGDSVEGKHVCSVGLRNRALKKLRVVLEPSLSA